MQAQHPLQPGPSNAHSRTAVAMDPLALVRLNALMAETLGSPTLRIGLIDGPVATDHADLAPQGLRRTAAGQDPGCRRTGSAACQHGTFVAGMLVARRGSPAPAMCPGCTLLLRTVFAESTGLEQVPHATPSELAAAIVDCIEAGAHVINLSLGLGETSPAGHRELEQALNLAARRAVIVVAAAGNQGTLDSSPITRHPWVIPVTACDAQGRPAGSSNLGASIGRNGLSAPGVDIRSLGAQGAPITLSGTSVAAPFVTGAIALLWSRFGRASAGRIRLAVTQPSGMRPQSAVPPLLDATAAWDCLRADS